MNLRKRTIYLVISAICLILIAILATSNLVVLAGFRELESEDAVTQVNRTTNALNEEIDSITTMVRDYANWDDTYQFVQDNNTAYIENNLVDETFEHLDVNLMIFLNSENQVVFSKTYDIVDLTPNQDLQNISGLIVNESLPLIEKNMTSNSGLICIFTNIFIFSSRPILTSGEEGPSTGTLIMAQQLTPDHISKLGEQTLQKVELSELFLSDLSPELQEAKQNLEKGNTYFLKEQNETTLNAFTRIADIHGNESIILKISLQRHIFNQGLSTINTFTIAIVVLFSIFGIFTILNLEKNVISRVINLKESVLRIRDVGIDKDRGFLVNPTNIGKKDELSSLSTSINNLLDNLVELNAKLQKSQRLAAVGELSGMVAHDLRNPLQSIKLANDLLKNEKLNNPEKKKKMLDLIEKEVSYCEKMVHDLLDYSRNIKLCPSETDLKSLVSMSLSHLQIPGNIKVEDLTQNEPKIKIDVEKILRVFDNLIKNAIDAMPQGGTLRIQGVFSGESVRVSFADTGIGISKDDLSKLFTPLFTTKAKGMGFGLSICQRIIEAHNGKITVESTPNIGTTFTVEIPTNINPPH
jgi:signal transduction histidine kinase